jgi:putative ABC transport system substrate-binding protein
MPLTIRRREVVAALCGAAAWSLAARAQQADKIARVGVLATSPDVPITALGFQNFVFQLRKLGFTEGHNLVLKVGRIDEGMAKAFATAKEMVAAKSDVLVASGPEIALQAASAARPAVPIVMLANNYDPLARGYAKSLAEPGGNITGLYYRQPELVMKQLELLLEALPERTRLAVLWDERSADSFRAVERAAEARRLSLHPLKLENPPYDFDTAFRTIARDQPQMLHVLSTPMFTAHRARIAELAIRYQLPTMFIFRHYVVAGGLMSYGVDTNPMWRRVASYVGKILRGVQPSELPIEQAANFELVLNLKTAKALGVDVPTSILLRADEVIE